MQKMTVCITENDIRENERFRLNNPIIYVLQRVTGTLWQLDEDGLLAEAMKPFRACQLSREVMDTYRRYQKTGKMEPFEFEIEFHYEALDTTPMIDTGRKATVANSLTETSSNFKETQKVSLMGRY